MMEVTDLVQTGTSFVAPASGAGKVICFGGGGGGTYNSPNGSPGGGGACAVKAVTWVEAQNYPYSIGVAGTSAAANADSNGGSTNFNSGACIAVGGVRGSGGGTGGAAGSCTGDTAFSGSNSQGVGTPARNGGSSGGSTGSAPNTNTAGAPDGVAGRSCVDAGSIYGAGATVSTGGTYLQAGKGAIEFTYPAPNPAGYPYLVGVRKGRMTTFAATFNVTLPPGDVGDQLVCVTGIESSTFTQTFTGWTQLAVVGGRFRVWTRTATGSDPVTASSFQDERDPWIVFRVKGSIAVLAASLSHGAAADPNPPALAAGTVAKRLWVVCTIFRAGATTGVGPLTFPSGMTGRIIVPNGLANSDLASCWQHVETDTFDPPAWDRGSAGATTSYSFTIGFEPVPEPPADDVFNAPLLAC